MTPSSSGSRRRLTIPCRDDLRRDDHRVHREVRRGRVPPATHDGDVEQVHGGHHRSRHHPDRADRQVVPEVHAERRVDARRRQHARRDHRRRAVVHLLGGLERELDRARERGRRQPPPDLEAHGDVTVVPARVHPPRVPRAVRHVVGFLDRQGVHVGAQQHARVAARPRRHHPGPADTGRHGIAQAPHPLGHDAGGAVLLERQLGMLMQIAPIRHQAVAVDGRDHHWGVPAIRGTGISEVARRQASSGRKTRVGGAPPDRSTLATTARLPSGNSPDRCTLISSDC
jgi:hypothetical protein